MSYKKSSIKKMIDDIDHKKVYLPALQRKFVWEKKQIELLFDSLMRNYPFGTFLFWRLHRQKAEQYVFYDFLTEYDERNPYNHRKIGAFTHEEIIGVLDGQQRLSSMYIGLMGTHTEKAPYKRTWSQDAYPKMCLYLNLLSLPYVVDAEDKIQTLEEQNFEFRFIKPENAAATERRVTRSDDDEPTIEPVFWMKVGEALSWDDEPEFDRIIDRFKDSCKSEKQLTAFSERRRQLRRALETLHRRIHKDELINYFEVAKDDLEDILKIFVRVNSGGTTLSKTDLLFSTIVATWDNGREEIEKLLKTINEKGDGFNFGNEFLMRCCLVLSDSPVVYKVNSFKSENVLRIRYEWPKIAKALEEMVDLLVGFGFNGELLTSQNATIIIAYYLYKGGSRDNESKTALRYYLIHAMLNGVYGSSQDQVISTLRNAFRKEERTEAGRTIYTGNFTKLALEDVLKISLPQQKSLAVTEADLERYLAHTKGPASFLVLTLLYPNLRYSEVVFHQDHIHPFSGFTNEKLKAMGISGDQFADWHARRDSVPNLQLLEGRRNVSKNATPLSAWLVGMSESARAAFTRDNYFPDDVGFDFANFIEFTNKRKDILRYELRQVLAIVPSPELTLAAGMTTDLDTIYVLNETNEEEYAS